MPHVSESFLSVSSLFYRNPHHPVRPLCHHWSDPVLLLCILIFTLSTFSLSVFYFYFPLVCLLICLHACVSVYSMHVEAWRSQKMDLQPMDRRHRWLGGTRRFREWTEFFWKSSRCSLLLSRLSRSLYLPIHPVFSRSAVLLMTHFLAFVFQEVNFPPLVSTLFLVMASLSSCKGI